MEKDMGLVKWVINRRIICANCKNPSRNSGICSFLDTIIRLRRYSSKITIPNIIIGYNDTNMNTNIL